MFYTINLTANKPYTHDVPGALILIDDIIGATGVDIALVHNGREAKFVPNRKTAFRMKAPFDAVIFRSAVACTVTVFLTFTDVSLGFADGASVNVDGQVKITNDGASRVPVDIGGGTVNVTASGVTVGNTDATAVPVKQLMAAAVSDPAPVAVTAAATVILAALPARRGLRLRNAGVNAVAIGGALVTFAAAAVVIQPGETWAEGDAPGAAWYGICEAGLSSTLNIQTVQ